MSPWSISRTTGGFDSAAGRWAIALLLFLGPLAPAEEKPAPSAAPVPAPQTEMQKWIATTDAQWQAAYKRDITDVHDGQLKKCSEQYAAGLESAFKKANAAGDLDASVAFRDELKRFSDARAIPSLDGDATPAVIKQVRAVYRAQFVQVEKDNAARAAALLTKYDQALAQAQTQLTQQSRLDDAVLVKQKREEVASAWLSPALGWRFRGDWVSKNKLTRIQFTAAGEFREFWNNTVQEGHWDAVSDTEAKVAMTTGGSKGNTLQYILPDEGKSVKRTRDNVVWFREPEK